MTIAGRTWEAIGRSAGDRLIENLLAGLRDRRRAYMVQDTCTATSRRISLVSSMRVRSDP